MYTIFVIEDEKEIRDQLVLLLENAGYRTKQAISFENLTEQVLKCMPDLLLLDVNLPGINGTWFCRSLRQKADIPVIFVTGRNTSMDELECMMAGADDYISKPYLPPILLARIEAVFRRTGKTAENQDRTVLTCKGVVLNLLDGTLSYGSRKTELTRNELRICSCLFRKEGEIVSRSDLIEELWDNEIYIDDNTLSVNITRIRGKLRQIGSDDLIQTRRGQGYIV